MALAIVAAFSSSQILWNKSNASIFVFYVTAFNAAIWSYEIINLFKPFVCLLGQLCGSDAENLWVSGKAS